MQMPMHADWSLYYKKTKNIGKKPSSAGKLRWRAHAPRTTGPLSIVAFPVSPVIRGLVPVSRTFLGLSKLLQYKSFQHTCTKPAHSCYRKLVSWFWHPAKRWLRNCNRAVLAVVRLVRPGFTVSGLKCAVSELQDACLALTQPPDEFHCSRCGRAKTPWEISVMDIEAMFESIEPHSVNLAIDSVADVLRARSVAGVVIPSSRQCKRKAFLTQMLISLSVACVLLQSRILQSVGSHMALTLLESWLWAGDSRDGCICDCFPSTRVATSCGCAGTAFGDDQSFQSDVKGHVHHHMGMNSHGNTQKSTDQMSLHANSNVLHSVVQTSSWAVDGFTMVLTALAWWHRRPGRL